LIKPVGATLIEAQYPIAQRLATHPAETRRLFAALAVVLYGRRQASARQNLG